MTTDTLTVPPPNAAQSEAIQKALTAQEEAIHNAVLCFQELLDAVNWHNGKQRFTQIVSEYYGDEERAAEFVQHCFDAKQELQNAHQRLREAAR